ncbi:MAG TPA: methionyl-tRNA formyltransferase [Salinimicrobium sp.]|nr:methionyl-tRNA formyltransferase [Salinimicrobium sp.]
MRDLRIVFMGTPEFAVHSLKSIVEAGYRVVGVVTAPDRPAGRGRKLQESAVKKYSLEQGLQVMQPTNLKDEAFIKELQLLNPNLQVVVAFRMLPKVVWDFPQFGTFNLHASLLPQYRGAAPINWAIMNGEELTGVSTFFLDEKIDTGEMILQKSVKIEPNENAESLHNKLMEIGADLVLDTLNLIQSEKIKTQSQPKDVVLKEAPKLTKENTRIDWGRPLDEIYNFIRGLSPYPVAWTPFWNSGNEMTLKIFEAEKEFQAHKLDIGKIIQEGKSIKVAVNNGFLILKKIQLPGKRKMPVKDLLNGFKFYPDAKVM